MAKSYGCILNGISTEIISVIDYVEERLNEKGVFCEKERLILDRRWLHKIWTNNPYIHFIQVVTVKPEGGKYIKRRYYFDVFLVKRTPRGFAEKTWMLYLVV